MMIKKLYFFFGYLMHGIGINCGKHVEFRWTGRMKNRRKITIGDDCFLGKNFRLYSWEKSDKNGEFGIIEIGNRVKMQEDCYISAMDLVHIGDDVLMGGGIMINDNNHGMDPLSQLSYCAQSCTYSAVIIENGVWIGEKVCILKGVTVGEKSIIGAGSIVTKDVPPYTIVAGNPAKVIKRYNFDSGEWN